MSRDVQAVIDGILPKPASGITILVLAIPTEHAHGIEREDLVTLNIKEKS
jgi:hypothetical protein